MEGSKIILELTLKEAMMLKDMIQKTTPTKEDEMLVIMLYHRICKLITYAP